MDKVNIVFFQRELRINDNLLIQEAINQYLPTIPIFIFNPKELNKTNNKDSKRIKFLANSVINFSKELRSFNYELLTFYNEPERILKTILNSKKINIESIIIGESYESNTIKLHKEIKKYKNINLIKINDSFLLPLDSCKKNDGTAFKVFTPFKNNFLTLVNQIPKPVKINTAKFKKLAITKKELDKIKSELKGLQLISQKELNIEAILNKLDFNDIILNDFEIQNLEKHKKNLFTKKIKKYDKSRDFMNEDGTSKLSPYIRYGLISIREIFYKSYELSKKSKGAETWMSELIWRDFYANITKEYPKILKSEFIEKYRDKIKWSNDKKAFKKWQDGETGYPIIDASMRQLKETGWMHNRARMIVASFLTKNMLIDWHWGEKHFADYLVDYEPSSNVGGWQWSASTGVDPQPYFRIFNPFTQAKKFDPNCDYIRKYIPELEQIPNKEILGEEAINGYYPHIVDYKKSREEALKVYKEVK